MEPQDPEATESALTFGQKAVKPNGDSTTQDAVDRCRQGFADLIDQMNNLRIASSSQDQKRHASVAITELETAQMRAVKAITWKD